MYSLQQTQLYSLHNWEFLSRIFKPSFTPFSIFNIFLRISRRFSTKSIFNVDEFRKLYLFRHVNDNFSSTLKDSALPFWKHRWYRPVSGEYTRLVGLPNVDHQTCLYSKRNWFVIQMCLRNGQRWLSLWSFHSYWKKYLSCFVYLQEII